MKSVFGLLLDRGVDINVTNSRSETALMWASTRGPKGCVRLLLNRGVNVDIETKNGLTALKIKNILNI